MKRATLTQHTVRCPLHGDAASLQVRTAADAAPSRRHRDVTACSLLTPMWFAPVARRAYFPDVPPPVSYLCDGGSPRQATEVCPKPCLGVLNAAEPGAAASLRCASGVCDGLELVRQTQSPAMTRVLWTHSV